jgi:hypothetical protein
MLCDKSVRCDIAERITSMHPVVSKNSIFRSRRSLPLLAVTMVAVALLPGCATDPAPKGSRFVISTPMAEFYTRGPAQDIGFQTGPTSSLRTLMAPVAGQNYGPDAQLPQGTSVTMLKREIGFSQVMTETGAVGYVANEQIRQAPALTRASVPAQWRSQDATPRRSRAQPKAAPEEHLDLSDIPLPLPS